MKERPILFSASMVRARLEGHKTVTRRVVKFNVAGRIGPLSNQWHVDDPGATAVCPYGQPGDLLWVKETFYAIGEVPGPPGSGQCWVHYRADSSNNLGDHDHQWRGPWTSPLFMRRRHSRITLEVINVRVERLQSITSADILAEGVRIPVDAATGNILLDISTKYGPAHFLGHDWRTAMRDTDMLLHALWAALWVSINGIDSWNANPWVWVIEFKRVEAQTA
jgi:hypothetical protein